MPDVDTSGYAVIDGVVRKVKIHAGGLYRDGKRWVIAVPFNPKKEKTNTHTAKPLLIDPMFVSSSMEELNARVKELRADTLKALTQWAEQ